MTINTKKINDVKVDIAALDMSAHYKMTFLQNVDTMFSEVLENVKAFMEHVATSMNVGYVQSDSDNALTLLDYTFVSKQGSVSTINGGKAQLYYSNGLFTFAVLGNNWRYQVRDLHFVVHFTKTMMDDSAIKGKLNYLKKMDARRANCVEKFESLQGIQGIHNLAMVGYYPSFMVGFDLTEKDVEDEAHEFDLLIEDPTLSTLLSIVESKQNCLDYF